MGGLCFDWFNVIIGWTQKHEDLLDHPIDMLHSMALRSVQVNEYARIS